MASNLLKALIRSQILPSSRRNFSVAATQIGIPTDDLVGNHTAKWMQIRVHRGMISARELLEFDIGPSF
ncbi:unnamed protein product [Microthlaspi erraticum]|uniref:Uncharacterized protein n=1 Tax=Microthlaspi erraticum TaxID=1685480 RepID=A0A6D2IQU1_9BRAS|nr:unnamed protein product [Microthlaspi erraticum]